jgi:hypothetical protein
MRRPESSAQPLLPPGIGGNAAAARATPAGRLSPGKSNPV